MANRKPRLLPMLLALRLLCGADGQQRTLQAGGGGSSRQPLPLSEDNLNLALEGISTAEDLRAALDRYLPPKEEGEELSTGSYNKAAAILYRARLESEFDNSRPRLYKWSVFVDEEWTAPESLGVYGARSMAAIPGFHLDPESSTFTVYQPPTGTLFAGKVVVVLITPVTAAHFWSQTTSQNFNQAVRQTAVDHRTLPLGMLAIAVDLANRFEELEDGIKLTAVIACPKITCGYSIPDGHILLYSDIFEIFPVARAALQPEVIAAMLPLAVGRR